MAKGSAQGLWRGKKGTSVFYKIKNSNNAQKQGIRERVYEISNPQSTGQASQRMKMLPAQRLANVLKSVIERGFEGIDYGVKSRQEFLKYALRMTTGFPATEKDATMVYPGKYLITSGSLPTLNGEFFDNDFIYQVGLRLPESFDADNIKSLSTALINNNRGLIMEGDQITLVFCVSINDQRDDLLQWVVSSFIVDTNNSESTPEPWYNLQRSDSGYLQFEADYIGAGGEYFAAATICISRESDNGGHLRSTQVLDIPSAYDYLFTNEAYARARRSYQRSNLKVTSDWPLEPDNTIGGVTVVDGEYTLFGLTGDKATANGTIVKVKVADETGDLKGVYIISNPQSIFNNALVDVTGTPVQYVDNTDPEQGLVTGLKPADVTALANLPTIPWS